MFWLPTFFSLFLLLLLTSVIRLLPLVVCNVIWREEKKMIAAVSANVKRLLLALLYIDILSLNKHKAQHLFAFFFSSNKYFCFIEAVVVVISLITSGCAISAVFKALYIETNLYGVLWKKKNTHFFLDKITGCVNKNPFTYWTVLLLLHIVVQSISCHVSISQKKRNAHSQAQPFD